MCDTLEKKITLKGLETGNILSYLSEDTLLTFYFYFYWQKVRLKA